MAIWAPKAPVTGSIAFYVVMLGSILKANCLDNGQARTPALGYNTWNAYGGDSTYSPVLEVAASDHSHQHKDLSICSTYLAYD